jgi:hypothetical protein
MALWTPARTTTALWLDAADAGTLYDATSGGSLVAADGAIARWEDKSGNGRHVTQGTLSRRPLRRLGIQNGRDIAEFDGTADYMYRGTSPISLNSFAAFSVFKFRSTTTSNRFAILGRTSDNLPIFFHRTQVVSGSQFYRSVVGDTDATLTGFNASFSTSAYIMFATTVTSSTHSFFIDGSLFGTPATQTATGTPNQWTIGALSSSSGASGQEFADMDACEFILTAGLTTSDRQRIEGYLAHKWGLAGNLPANHPYKTNAPKYGIGGIAAVIAEMI